jgi:hypothetical protein
MMYRTTVVWFGMKLRKKRKNKMEKQYNFIFSDGVTLKCSLRFAQIREEVLGTTYKLFM